MSEDSYHSSTGSNQRPMELQFHDYSMRGPMDHMGGTNMLGGMALQPTIDSFGQPSYYLQPTSYIPAQHMAAQGPGEYQLPTENTLRSAGKPPSTGNLVLQDQKVTSRRSSAGSKSDGRLSPKNQLQTTYQGKMYLVDPNEETEKKARRLLKNRQAAKDSRKRKKELVSDLEQRFFALEESHRFVLAQLARYREIYGDLPS